MIDVNVIKQLIYKIIAISVHFQPQIPPDGMCNLMRACYVCVVCYVYFVIELQYVTYKCIKM